MAMFFSDRHIQPDTPLRRHSLLCIVALGLFFLLLFLATRVPAVIALDSAVSVSVQSMRNAPLDRAMLVITMLADAELAGWIGLLVLLYLITSRQWWLSLHLSCVILSAAWTVVLLKNLIGRIRPPLPYGALEGFSLPSGHACTAMLMSGILAVLLARSSTRTVRLSAIGCAGIFSALVAFSRVYLLAHWPTDVLAGLCLGLALASAFAWQLHVSTLPRGGKWPAIIAGWIVLVAAVHLTTSLETQTAVYGLQPD